MEPFNRFISNPDATATITVEMVKAVMQKIYEDGGKPCPHMVGPRDKGWTTCAMCFAPVYVEESLL